MRAFPAARVRPTRLVVGRKRAGEGRSIMGPANLITARSTAWVPRSTQRSGGRASVGETTDCAPIAGPSCTPSTTVVNLCSGHSVFRNPKACKGLRFRIENQSELRKSKEDQGLGRNGGSGMTAARAKTRKRSPVGARRWKTLSGRGRARKGDAPGHPPVHQFGVCTGVYFGYFVNLGALFVHQFGVCTGVYFGYFVNLGALFVHRFDDLCGGIFRISRKSRKRFPVGARRWKMWGGWGRRPQPPTLDGHLLKAWCAPSRERWEKLPGTQPIVRECGIPGVAGAEEAGRPTCPGSVSRPTGARGAALPFAPPTHPARCGARTVRRQEKVCVPSATPIGYAGASSRG